MNTWLALPALRILVGLVVVVCLLPPRFVLADDGFSFGAGGSGSFCQFVTKDSRATLGTIPAGTKNLTVSLKAENDLDIELWDGNTFVVGWEVAGVNAQIYSDRQITGNYRGVRITWSGWDGTDGRRGNEFINIQGTTQNPFVMKVFGYEAGAVSVEYYWDVPGISALPPTGSGTFTRYLRQNCRVAIGTIPTGITNLTVNLTADTDLDIELWDGNTFVVGWEADGVEARIHGSKQISGTHRGVTLTWSGWDGTRW